MISLNGGTYPDAWPEARRAAFEAACLAGGTTFSGAGLNPGFAAEKLAVQLSGLCTDVQHVHIRETVDCRAVKSAAYVFDVIGFGTEPEAVDPNAQDFAPAQTMNALFGDVVAAVGARLGLRFSSVRTAHELRPAAQALTIAAGRIEAGRTGEIAWRWTGMTGDAARVTLEICWTMMPPEPAGPLWTVEITGTPCVKVALDLAPPPGWTFRTTAEQLGVAGAVLNSIEAVVNAPPGLLATPVVTPWRERRG